MVRFGCDRPTADSRGDLAMGMVGQMSREGVTNPAVVLEAWSEDVAIPARGRRRLIRIDFVACQWVIGGVGGR